MGIIHTARDSPDDHALEPRQAGPTLLRMLVGAQLRRLREADGITAKNAGEVIRASHSKISRLEGGRTGFKLRDVADLLTFYGVHDEAERASLLALAKQANEPPWWHPYSDVVPSWFDAYLGLEHAASVIRTYEVQFVPGLLQINDYARAVIKLGHEGASGSEIERRVELRMKRQQILHRADPPLLWVVIDEAALRRPIGSTATMRAQLTHLLDIAELPAVTIAMVPFSAGGHAAAGGPMTILRFAADEIPDVIYLEQLSSAIYVDKPAEIDRYWHVMNRLAVEAESATATTAILRQILRET
jgi:transcriptional regulator with XRE-family HTH domain